MKLSLLTEPLYQDPYGVNWSINASQDMPIIKQYMDKIVAVTRHVLNIYKKPIAYHFWIRLNEQHSLTKFTDLLRKRFQRNNGLDVHYIQVKENDDNMFFHHHFFIFLDRAVVRPCGLGYFLKQITGPGKALLCYGMCPSKQGKLFMTMDDVDEIHDVVHRASYLAKSRSKAPQGSRRQISTSQIN